MGKPSAPAPPDYAAAAKAQGEANLASALATNYMNQQNQITPTGSLTYDYSTKESGKGYYLPDGTYVPQATVTTTLSPEQQKLYNQNTQISQNLNDIALQGIDYVGNTALQQIDLNGLPQAGQAPGQANYVTALQGVDAPLPTQYDFSNVSQMPKYSDFNGARDQITDAYMQRLQPYIDRDRSAMEQRLANQGLQTGGEAYGAENDIFNRGVNDQRIAALLAGDQQQQNLFQNGLALRQQGIGEAMSQGEFGRSAFAAQMQKGLANAGLANQAASENFQQGLAGANFNQQARQQALQEADYLRNYPLNILNALRTGNQVSMPQFSNTAAGAQVQSAPIYQATADQYNAALNSYNTKMQGWSGLVGGLTGIGSAFAMPG